MPPSSDSLAAPATTDEALVGRKVGKYEILRSIGRGGMGTVYEALNTAIGKRVAMKFVGAEMAQNREAVARFQREAEAASAVESAHIVQIFDSGVSEDGVPFLVMELLRGEDLGHRIKRCGRLELSEAAHITAQILLGHHRAHEAGIVHRDLKPDNVFLIDRDDDANFAKILDFGISKIQRTGDAPAHTLTRQGTVLGTPFYMSPEQAQALPDIDGRTDIWSVGAILFECLTGRPPHSGGTYEQVIISICMKDTDDVRMHNPIVPEAMAQVIRRALSREREGRFSTAREFLDALVSGSGGVLSASSGRLSGDEAPSGPRGATSSPGLSGRTPMRATPMRDTPDPEGLAPTLDARGEAPSKIGWSTSGGAAQRRGRRLYAAIGGIALVALLGGAAVAVGLRQPESPPATPEDATRPPSPLEVKLASNVAGARFLVDGALAPAGVVKGASGEVKKVRVEAEGFTAVEKDVVLDAAQPTVTIHLEAQAPTVDTAAPEPDASSKKAGTPGKTGRTHPGGAASAKTPATKPTGVAGGLQLKED